jgi:hypothetical protein
MRILVETFFKIHFTAKLPSILARRGSITKPKHGSQVFIRSIKPSIDPIVGRSVAQETHKIKGGESPFVAEEAGGHRRACSLTTGDIDL